MASSSKVYSPSAVLSGCTMLIWATVGHCTCVCILHTQTDKRTEGCYQVHYPGLPLQRAPATCCNLICLPQSFQFICACVQSVKKQHVGRGRWFYVWWRGIRLGKGFFCANLMCSLILKYCRISVPIFEAKHPLNHIKNRAGFLASQWFSKIEAALSVSHIIAHYLSLSSSNHEPSILTMRRDARKRK